MLSKNGSTDPVSPDKTVIIPPVDLGENVEIAESVVGPYVSVNDEATITESIVRNGIVGRNTTLQNVNLEESIIGDGATVRSESNHLNVGDNSTIEL
jgi:glucose-1-phosphate thymidylyltransferase